MSVTSRGSRRSHTQSNHSRSNHSGGSIPQPPYGQALTPSNDNVFEPCSATDSYFLYAQRNVILCLQHDSLAIVRRFEKHNEDVQLIVADNVSDRGNGRLVVSYDSSLTTIVWDVMTGEEIARFASYEDIRTAAWMKNSNIAFGNSQGNVILFEPSTSEHISARTIFDPITALAPAADCRTFALGYLNGSILIATLQPSFTILHTLSTNRAPSPLNKLAWHGSSSKQKSDMLAAQTIDGDLRVWSIPKAQGADQPSIIRVLSRSEHENYGGACWFGWSKMGRIVQYSNGLTYVWDVRTKRVTYESVPTVDGLIGITNHGPGAKLFTLGRNHTVQQYDLNPMARPMLVQNVQHVPGALPPSPPISDGQDDKGTRYVTAEPSMQRNSNLPLYLDIESSDAEEGMMKSPLQRISQHRDDEDMSEEELQEGRDQLGPLSPVSSRASTTSRSSRGGGQRRRKEPRDYERDRERPMSPGMHSTHSGSTHTTFSVGTTSMRSGFQHRAMRESVSTRSLLSTSTSASKSSKTSRLRQEVLRSPEETKNTMLMDLFPYTKARLAEVVFRAPQYDQNRRTPDDLRNQMLDVVFGWTDDIVELIKEELSHHPPSSASAVLLAKWLGDLGADIAASMIGSESMTSSDWMLLALSTMGQDSQKKVGEAFVQRLLEKGDIHPAVSILLGLGEYNEAVEVYVSRKYYMEAVLLTCLLFPTDWGRISHLVRKWGEVVMTQGQPELAVRCFSCTSMESSEPWFSPRAQDEVYALQQKILAPDTPSSVGPSPVSPGTRRLLPNQAGLRLVTNFSQKAGPAELATAIDDKTPMVFSPAERRDRRHDPMSAMSTRTATPGGFARRRFPSTSRSRGYETTTPQVDSSRFEYPNTAVKTTHSEVSSVVSSRARSVSASQAGSFLTESTYQENDRGREGLPSPALDRFHKHTPSRSGGSERNKEGLILRIEDVIVDSSIPSSIPTGASASEFAQIAAGSQSGATSQQRGIAGLQSNPSDMVNSKIRSIDEYINSLNDAHTQGRTRAESRSRNADRPGSRTAHRAPSERHGRDNTKYIRPAKRSPSSPISMSPDDPALQLSRYDLSSVTDAESFYKLTEPNEPVRPRERDLSRDPGGRAGSRATSRDGRRTRSRSRATTSRQDAYEEHDRSGRGRSAIRREESPPRSPPSPRPMSPSGSTMSRSKVGERVRERSMSRRPAEQRRQQSPEPVATGMRRPSKPAMPRLQTNLSDSAPMSRTRKDIAAEELEARRLSLLRKPSAPPVIHPDELGSRSAIEPSVDPSSLFTIANDLQAMRGHTADPHALRKVTNQGSGTSTSSAQIGLPATPRAMRHPKDMAGSGEPVPAVPEIPVGYAGPSAPASSQEQPEVLTLLPTSTYRPPTGPHSRSASAPPEKFQGHHRRISSAHSRQNSRDDKKDNITVVSPGANGTLQLSRNIDEAIRESQVIIVEQPETLEAAPPMLPELQHLAGPPPPPPPPAPVAPPVHSTSLNEGANMSAPVEDQTQRVSPQIETPPIESTPMPDPSATPAHGHRRGRNSISESVGSRIRGAFGGNRHRDRSASRQRPVISPPVPTNHAPYESIQPQRRPSQPNVPQMRAAVPYESIARVTSPPQQSHQAGPALLPSTTYQGYRNPKEIARQMREREEQAMMAAGLDRAGASTAPPRSTSKVRANMPPNWTQAGAEPPPI
ncbi:hypothetical protein, variant [Verruconis gallopava]|uniref:Gem-associated protein 5 TPR domain-containing protein n=1 Tax=Verruconis gallopava TaxID=253628 RepID=A0A0D2AJ08_9PEZI|nr:uncharacterized protein PV09_02564 [Verruconis gallopava]XP_016216763.1 hypothetical protein, variant [Verruconis gallopava]KIW06893.1 hypothetical protein PV09_02564 [Verruconis gallopava]KIW06894.1 hypothetical protein, variant [Verruconis gallopava]